MSVDFSVTDRIATIVLNRPERLNALTDEMWDQFSDALERCETDDDIRAVILTGTGKGFCAGADVSGEGRVWPRKPGTAGILELAGKYDSMISRLYHLKKPTIAAVNGVAVGIAWTMVLCCDWILVTENSKFRPGFVNLAKVPEGGFQFLMTRVVGELKARDIIYRSQFVSAPEAVDLGLATRLVAADMLLEEAKTLAGEAVLMAPLTFALTKELFNDNSGDFDSYLQKEKQAITLAACTEDAKEGVAAFMEKRDPAFRGV